MYVCMSLILLACFHTCVVHVDSKFVETSCVRTLLTKLS
uniref:Uncharacterized protein n=1 Tax=Rhizophora mucronata TaxID=61149 RepID=A0A2P2QCB2_RHIMU